MQQPSSPARAWAVRSVYGILLLAMLYYFQNKTAEQARIYHAATGFLPHAVAEVEKTNQWYFQKIEEAFAAYPNDQTGKYHGIAASVSERTTGYAAYLAGMAELPGRNNRSDALRRAIPDLIAMRDTVAVDCDNDPACSHFLKNIVPDADDVRWKAVARLDAIQRTNMLQLQNALAGSVAIKYLYDRVRGSEVCGGWGGDPSIMNLQIFPAVGDWYEAVVFSREYVCLPTILRFKINGMIYPTKDGFVEYRHRFARPGKHRVQVAVDLLAAKDSTVLATNVQEFEINVLPRPIDSDSLKSR